VKIRDELSLNTLNFIPPDTFLEKFQNDYKEMQNSMIYGECPDFKTLIDELTAFKKQISLFYPAT